MSIGDGVVTEKIRQQSVLGEMDFHASWAEAVEKGHNCLLKATFVSEIIGEYVKPESCLQFGW